MIATLLLTVCGFLVFITQNAYLYISVKKNISPYAPCISIYFLSNRKKLLFTLIGIGLVLSGILFGLYFNMDAKWSEQKNLTLLFATPITVGFTIAIAMATRGLFKRLLEIEEYAYMHHASQLQHQSKIDYSKIYKKIISWYLSGYAIWLNQAIIFMFFNN